HGIVILATVMLQRVPYPTPAVWISEGIEIASACARVVKGLAILPRKNLRLKCSVVRMLFQPIDHGCIPIRGDLHIRIEQDKMFEFRLQCLHPGIIATSIAEVGLKGY